MNGRRPRASRVWPLLLLLLAGPLQAETRFHCAMMDTIVHGECCCATHRAQGDCTGDGAYAGQTNPCCERSIALSFAPDAQTDRPGFKPAEVRSGLDPPPAVADSAGPPAALRRPAPGADPFPPYHHGVGSELYLITLRLRI